TLYDQFNAELPISTKILISISDMIRVFWPVLLIGLFIGAYGFKMYAATSAGRRKIDEHILRIPLVGDLQRQIVLTELTRTLSLMVGSGVSILEGLQVTSGVVNNKIIAEALDDSAGMVEKGFPVAFAFSRHPEAFPFIL